VTVVPPRSRGRLPAVALADAVRDPDGNSFRRAELRGRFELADTVLVGPVERGMELGARVLTPLQLEGEPDGAPRVLVDRGCEASGFPLAEPARPVSPVDHRGYAITWFAVAALSLGAWIEYGRRRAREAEARSATRPSNPP
jgi:cytochrome oxidase assembly protein ShyY1